MQLVSFQIKECFGFRDSGRIDLQDLTNLIYILGRNSSGKTSSLTALAHFDHNLIPKDHPNFKNFDSSSEDISSLICEYRVNADDLSTDAFRNVYFQRLRELNEEISITDDEYRLLVCAFYEDMSRCFSEHDGKGKRCNEWPTRVGSNGKK